MVSIWTVKKRWQKIYEKVELVAPTLLQSEIEARGAPESSSGRRRRHLLDFLRQHLQEIRPTANARPEARV